MHIFCLGRELVRRGHRVVVATHRYEGYTGVRWLADGIKVYYLPMEPFVQNDTFPTIFAFMPLFRDLCLREGVDIVHAHTTASNLGAEALQQARVLGLRTVFTEHSLFPLGTVEAINLTKAFRFAVCAADHVVCVSEACRANFVQRTRFPAACVSVVPNAIDVEAFRPPAPDAAGRSGGGGGDDGVTVVVVSRLVWRKGTLLLARVIPAVCARHPSVRFVIGGDGPLRVALETMRETHNLHSRVEMLGEVPHHAVPAVLARGHIFLNCSLTEAFCIAILEAASSGLHVVATAVGGVPEVLPPALMTAVPPDVDALTDAVLDAVNNHRWLSPEDRHAHVRGAYAWARTARATEAVYASVLRLPAVDLADDIARHAVAGPILGFLSVFILGTMHIVARLCAWLRPASDILPAVDWSAAVRQRRAATTAPNPAHPPSP